MKKPHPTFLLLERGVWCLFILTPHLHIHELPRNIHEKKFRTLEGTMARWCETNETHDGTRPPEFSTLDRVLCVATSIRNN